MRYLIALLVLVSAGYPATAASFSGKLLTYEQMLALKPDQRREYIRGMVRLMIEMENAVTAYSVADRDRLQEMREQVAQIMRDFDILPQAQARTDEAEEAKAEVKPASEATSPPSPWSPEAGRTRPEAPATPGATPMATPQDRRMKAMKRLRPNQYPDLPEKAEPAAAPAAAGSEQCEPAPSVCEGVSEEARTVATNNFRNNTSSNVCIAGGFASRYRGTQKKAGTCDIPTVINLTEKRKSAPCGRGQALCNPVLFCLGGKVGDQFTPVTYCVDRVGPAKNRAITEECAKEFTAILEKKKPLARCPVAGKRGKNETKAAYAKRVSYAKRCQIAVKQAEPAECDPHNHPVFSAASEWNKLVKDVESLHGTFCKEENSKVVFCKECDVINKRVFEMTKLANNTGCDPSKMPGVSAAPAPAAEQSTDSKTTN